MNRTELRHIALWVGKLAELTVSSNQSPPSAEKTALYVDMLARDFGIDSFTTASLSDVAQASKFFPSYQELSRALSKWRRANTQRLPAIEGPSYDIPKRHAEAATPASRIYVSEIVKAFVGERSFKQPQTVGEGPEGKPVRPSFLSDERLLVDYERTAMNASEPPNVRTLAATRAATIRRKLGMPVAANDRDKPQEDARP